MLCAPWYCTVLTGLAVDLQSKRSSEEQLALQSVVLHNQKLEEQITESEAARHRYEKKCEDLQRNVDHLLRKLPPKRAHDADCL